MNDIPLQHKGIQISTRAFCAQCLWAGWGGPPPPHRQDPTDGDKHIHWDRSTHLHNAGLAAPATWSSIFPESLSSLTLDLYTSSTGSPSSCPEGMGTMGIRDCVCVCVYELDTKESDLMEHKGDSKILSEPESNGGSTALTLAAVWFMLICSAACSKTKSCTGVFLYSHIPKFHFRTRRGLHFHLAAGVWQYCGNNFSTRFSRAACWSGGEFETFTAMGGEGISVKWNQNFLIHFYVGSFVDGPRRCHGWVHTHLHWMGRRRRKSGGKKQWNSTIDRSK